LTLDFFVPVFLPYNMAIFSMQYVQSTFTDIRFESVPDRYQDPNSAYQVLDTELRSGGELYTEGLSPKFKLNNATRLLTMKGKLILGSLTFWQESERTIATFVYDMQPAILRELVVTSLVPLLGTGYERNVNAYFSSSEDDINGRLFYEHQHTFTHMLDGNGQVITIPSESQVYTED
jgi:hypothetical protein